MITANGLVNNAYRNEIQAEITLDDLFFPADWRTSRLIDVYKGISVGKTLDEINSNPDLQNTFALATYEGEYLRGEYRKFSAIGFYIYNGKGIQIFLGFNDDFVCTDIFLCPSEENPGYTEIWR